MFPISGPMRTLIASEHYTIHVRVYGFRPGGIVTVDLTDRFVRGSISASMDDQARRIGLTFLRGAGTASLSPLYTTSGYNDPSPILQEGNEINIWVAIMAPGASPAFDADYILLDIMRIDKWDAGAGPYIEVTGRDLSSAMALDRLVEEPTAYGPALAEDVIQDLLEDWVVSPFTPIDLPDGSPGFMVNKYPQQEQSVMEAIQAIALLRGWDVRHFPSDPHPLFSYYDPGRARTVADATIALSEYTRIEELASTDAEVRNVWHGVYDKAGTRLEATASDATSIAQYGRKFARIAESVTSPIDTQTELQDMVDWALADTKDPYASHRVSTLLWPFVELNDLHAYPATPEHYDAEQKYAVVAYTHEFTASSGRTTMSVRGKPIAAYRRWRAGTTPSVIVSLNDPPAAGYAREGMLWAKVDSLAFPP